MLRPGTLAQGPISRLRQGWALAARPRCKRNEPGAFFPIITRRSRYEERNMPQVRGVFDLQAHGGSLRARRESSSLWRSRHVQPLLPSTFVLCDTLGVPDRPHYPEARSRSSRHSRSSAFVTGTLRSPTSSAESNRSPVVYRNVSRRQRCAGIGLDSDCRGPRSIR